MTKNQFLDNLRTALNGKVSSGLVTENLRYYEDYINTEIRKGKSEAEVLETLGDPRLIARTIAETKGGSGSRFEEYGEGSRADDGREGEDYDFARNGGRMVPGLFFRLPVWAWLLVVLVVVILVLSVIFSVIAAVLPVLLPILLVLFLVKLFRDWIN